MSILLEGFPTIQGFFVFFGVFTSAICIFICLCMLASLPFRCIWKKLEQLDNEAWKVRTDMNSRDHDLEKRIKYLEERIRENL